MSARVKVVGLVCAVLVLTVALLLLRPLTSYTLTPARHDGSLYDTSDTYDCQYLTMSKPFDNGWRECPLFYPRPLFRN